MWNRIVCGARAILCSPPGKRGWKMGSAGSACTRIPGPGRRGSDCEASVHLTVRRRRRNPNTLLRSPVLYGNKKPTSPEQGLGACGAGQGPRSPQGAKGRCEAVSEAEGPRGVLRSPSSFSRPLAPSLEVQSYVEELSFGPAAGEESNRGRDGWMASPTQWT